MKIQKLILHPYVPSLYQSYPLRKGVSVQLVDALGREGWGEIAPLPKWSQETLEEALAQLDQKRETLFQTDWTVSTCLRELEELNLLPSVLFGLESALLAILDPLPESSSPRNISALLMGTPQEILEQAALRHSEGFVSAKLKVSQLSFAEAAPLIHLLKEKFYLRIDVNRAWSTFDSLRFFAQFPLDTFDYVEEPFQNPQELEQFLHPLAVDESFPQDLSLEQLEKLPTLKALIYKPTIQGGMLKALPLKEWTDNRGISLVLSSSFESGLGLRCIASIAERLSLKAPLGIGTECFFISPKIT